MPVIPDAVARQAQIASKMVQERDAEIERLRGELVVFAKRLNLVDAHCASLATQLVLTQRLVDSERWKRETAERRARELLQSREEGGV